MHAVSYERVRMFDNDVQVESEYAHRWQVDGKRFELDREQVTKYGGCVSLVVIQFLFARGWRWSEGKHGWLLGRVHYCATLGISEGEYRFARERWNVYAL